MPLRRSSPSIGSHRQSRGPVNKRRHLHDTAWPWTTHTRHAGTHDISCRHSRMRTCFSAVQGGMHCISYFEVDLAIGTP